MMWSASNGCVEKAAGLRQYSHRHGARCATRRLNRREGRLEDTRIFRNPEFSHEQPYLCIAVLGEARQGLQPGNVHLLDALPQPLELGFLRSGQPFGLLLSPQIIELSLLGCWKPGVLLDAGRARCLRLLAPPVRVLPPGEPLLE